MINIVISLIVALILVPVMHGVFLKWHNLYLPLTPLKDIKLEAKRQAEIYSFGVVWHRVALGLRLSLWLALWFATERNYWITGIIIVATSIAYPIIINLINGWKWYFVGTTSLTDRIIRKVLFFVNFD